ncbi:MAG: metallophosphoesterase, partial [Nanoarchaeota archaeon]
MKILAFSDIHGDINYLRDIYKKFKGENPDIIICAGDIFEFYNFSNKIKKLLQSFDKTILM